MSAKADASHIPSSRQCDGELQTVDKLDLERYMGKWYEIARYENRHQRGTVATTTEFKLRDDGMIDVISTARKRDLDGKVKTTDAKGWIVDEDSKAKWKVQWFWLLRSDYWMIYVSDDYQHAVIGQPSMEKEQFEKICRVIQTKGFDPDRLVMTPQLAKSKKTYCDAQLAKSGR